MRSACNIILFSVLTQDIVTVNLPNTTHRKNSHLT